MIMADIEFNVADFLSADDTALEFDMADFDMADIGPQTTRYQKPRFAKNPITVHYNYARELARDIKLHPGEQIHCIVGGNFVFGDLFEALLTEKKVRAKSMHVATLSLSQNNIDSFKTLLETDLTATLDIAVSNYFYSHEKATLIPYMLQELDIDNRFNLAVFRNHTKIVLMEIGNIYLTMTGSANLRSSRSVEQFALQESKELYEFYRQWFDENMDNYGIIDKEVDQ
jgi:hypothetical protein